MPGLESSPLNSAIWKNASPNDPLNPRRIIAPEDLSEESKNPFAKETKLGPNVDPNNKQKDS